MPGWVIWMLVAAALAGGEMLTLGLFLGPLSLAAVLAALVALGGGSVELQAAAFVAGSVAALAIVRPIARRHMRTPAHIRTGAAALIGQRAIVLEKVDADGGLVKIGGEVWTARAYDEDHVIEPGTRVEVMVIQGATALVSE
ncbi:MAG: NfeD family protein [Actinobacteria bacterium]|nr:MAG: NfeD family protein [Actinomycetota bacterium]TML82620.1 MAG: NfeD family protein [Actinomycetota bacterium]